MEHDDSNLVLSPLADPVASAILADVNVAGLALESLIRAVLEEAQHKFAGKIVSVTPQYTHSGVRTRGCRVDVEVKTDANEYAIFELQITPDRNIMLRDLFAASHIFTRGASKGDSAAQMAQKMPTVIGINILCYNVRENNTDIVQPFEILYTKEPTEIAIPNFSGYNVQLPRILDMEPDFTNALYCWCYTLYTAHTKTMTIQEVLDMTPALQEYATEDAGYRQFCDQYNLVACSPEARHEYYLWYKDRMREDGMMLAAMYEVAQKLKERNTPYAVISDSTGLSVNEIEKL